MIRMKHELHGFTHANDGNEEKYLRNLGWIAETEKFASEVDVEVKLKIKSEDEPAPPGFEQDASKITRPPGRPRKTQ